MKASRFPIGLRWFWPCTLVIACAVAGCAKTAPPAAKPASGTASVAQQADHAAAATDADRAKLATAYQVIRCSLVGAALPSERLYQDQGFVDGAGFAKAFDDAARASPAWARQVVSDAFAHPCQEHAQGPAGGVTPTSPASPVTAAGVQ